VISLDADRLATVMAARDGWNLWADSEESKVAKGIGFAPNVSTGRSVALSLQMEIDTGIPHCACCLKPICAEKPYWKR